jgi:hypothetical protein
MTQTTISSATVTPATVLRWHKPLLALTAVMAVLAAVAGVAIFADARVLTGVPIWLKPFKFSVSFAVYAFTLAWLLSLLPRRSRVAEWAGVLIVAVSLTETAIIVTQVIRGTTSHYNETTPFNAALWSAMGNAIALLFLAQLVIAVVVLRQRIADRSLAYAIRIGLGVSLLGMLAAVPMVTPAQDPGIEGIVGAHSVGVPDGGPGMPLTGWSTTGGDLRIGHFVGLHALQFFPLLGFLLARYLGRRLSEATRARLLLVAGGAYGVLVVLLTWQALRAQPLLRPDIVTLAAWAGLLAATAAGTALVLRKN